MDPLIHFLYKACGLLPYEMDASIIIFAYMDGIHENTVYIQIYVLNTFYIFYYMLQIYIYFKHFHDLS